MEEFEVSELVAEDVRWLANASGRQQECSPSEEFGKTFKRFDADDLSMLLKKKSVKAELGKVVELYVDALKNQKWRYYITAKECVSILKAIAPDVREEFDYKIKSSDYKALTEYFDNFWNMKEARLDKLLEALPGNAKGYAYALATPLPMLFFSLLIALLVFNIVMLHIKNKSRLLMNAGAPVAASGFIFLVAGLIGGPMSFVLGRNAEMLFSRYLPWITSMFLVYGLILLLAGGAVVALSFWARAAQSKKPLRAAAKVSGFGNLEKTLVLVLGNVIIAVSCGIVSLLIINLIR
jgi:hypothetical protein